MKSQSIEKFFKYPPFYFKILKQSKKACFNYNSDEFTGSLLRSLATSKPSSYILELGTGCGLGTSWLLDGMDKNSVLHTVEKENSLIQIAKNYFFDDPRARFFCANGENFIKENKQQYDIIFADTWPGKFYLLEEVLNLLKPGRDID